MLYLYKTIKNAYWAHYLNSKKNINIYRLLDKTNKKKMNGKINPNIYRILVILYIYKNVFNKTL